MTVSDLETPNALTWIRQTRQSACQSTSQKSRSEAYAACWMKHSHSASKRELNYAEGGSYRLVNCCMAGVRGPLLWHKY